MKTNPFKRFALKQQSSEDRTDKVRDQPESVAVEEAPVKKQRIELKRDDRLPTITENVEFQIKKEPVVQSAKELKKEQPIWTKQPLLSDISGITIKSEQIDDEAHTSTVRDNRLVLLQELMHVRKTMVTPIDQYGTHACAFSESCDGPIKRFQVLIAALLSSQTKDPITFAAMQRLHQYSNQASITNDSSSSSMGITNAIVRGMPEDTLDALLTPVGFHRKKAQHIKQVAEVLHAKYKDDIPTSYKELVALPGIGPKIARLILLVAWDQIDGLIVDTHVHRLAHRLHWTTASGQKDKDTQKIAPFKVKQLTPEETRKALEEWVPPEYWKPFSVAVIGFGQTICTAIRPKCATCPLKQHCPSAGKIK